MKLIAPEADIRHNISGPIDGIGSDVAVIAIGEKPFAEFKSDCKNLSLNKALVKLVKQCKKEGMKTVVLLVVSRPVIIDKILELADVVMVVWLPGTEGTGVTYVLFGDYAPVGKIPVTWPASMDQIPINIDDAEYKALFEFGYGLTYKK